MVGTNSHKQYLQTYLALVKNAKSEDICDIYNYILKKNVKDNTKASYLNSVISLKKIDSKLVKGDLKDIIEYRDKLNIKIEKDRETNNITDGQQKALNTISLKDLHDFVIELDAKKTHSLKELEDYILIAMMVHFPLRNDLQEIRLSTHKQDLKAPFNVLYIPKKGNAFLSLKEYKTSYKEGDLLMELPDTLSNDVRLLIKLDTFRKYLFVNRSGEPLSSSSFTHRLHSITNNKFKIPISSTIIRKIYLSGKYGDVIEDMKKDSAIMGHSMATQQKVYISNNKKNQSVKQEGKTKIIKD